MMTHIVKQDKDIPKHKKMQKMIMHVYRAELMSYKKPPNIVANVVIVISLNEWGGYITIYVIKIVPKTARFYWEILVWWYLRGKEEAIKQVMIV